MKTNYKIIIAVCIAVFGLHSCNDIYDNINKSEANSRIIATSQMNFSNTIRIGTSITLGDISSGVESRLWTLPEGVADIVGSDNDVTATTENVKAIFNVAGAHDVKLHQVFKGDAYTVKESTPKGRELDTTIVVTVLPEIKTVLKAYKLNTDGTLGAALNLSNEAKNEIPAGSTIRYVVESAIGAPENYTWTADGGTTVALSTDKMTYDVKYKKLGNFGFKLNASGVRPFGEEITEFTNLIKIIPSTNPVTLDGVEARGNSIYLNFSRDIDETTLVATNFSVTITNGGVTTPSIASATIDSKEGNLVVLKLGINSFYSNDVITASYTKGALLTSDLVPVDSFTNKPATLIEINALAATAFDYSFEKSATADWKYLGWGAPYDKYTFEISTAKARTGIKSGLITMKANGAMVMGYKPANTDNAKFAFGAKTYILGAWIYVTTSTNVASGDLPEFRFYVNPPFAEVIVIPAFDASIPLNKWVYVKKQFTMNGPSSSELVMRGTNTNNSNDFKFYIDDLTIIEANNKP
ncbi:hypothetical protein [Flavobacterium sp.]|uniref:hypothetical protein n=1 Tax=Flavobacterium sp. TaxID=239 RepID=UPI003C376903